MNLCKNNYYKFCENDAILWCEYVSFFVLFFFFKFGERKKIFIDAN